MSPILFYIIKVTGSFSLFYICYHYLLRTDTYFIRNRFYLLGSILISVIAPLLKITVKTIKIQAFPNIQPIDNFQPAVIPTSVENNFWPFVLKIVLIIYCIGIVIFLLRLLWAYYSTINIIINSERKKFYSLVLAFTRLTISPFSLFKWLVIPKNKINHPDFDHIVQHESIHSRQYHSVDLFMAEIMIAFQWFNPFVWKLKKAIIENHEYFVDKTLLRNGVDPQKYQYSLLTFAMSQGGQLAVANHFNSNLLKKRIHMMNKNQSPQWHRIKNFSILLATSLVILTTVSFETKVIAQTPQNDPMVIINDQISNITHLQNLNPQTIKKVTVLKDSAAIATYGNKAKNGVVIVELKDTIHNKSVVFEDISNSLNDSTKVKVIRITGYGKQDTLGNRVSVRKTKQRPLVILDGKKMADPESVFNNPSAMAKMEVLKGDKAIELYGDEGKNGVIILTSKQENQNSSVDNFIKINGKNITPLYVLDGKIISAENFGKINAESILSINVLKNEIALEKYGDKGKDGVIEINTKSHVSNTLSVAFSQNPVNDKVTITINDNASEKTSYTILVNNKMGETIFKTTSDEKIITIPVSDYKEDMYIINVISESTKVKGSAILMVKH
jgi:bla regulator protein blaR1